MVALWKRIKELMDHRKNGYLKEIFATFLDYRMDHTGVVGTLVINQCLRTLGMAVYDLIRVWRGEDKDIHGFPIL